MFCLGRKIVTFELTKEQKQIQKAARDFVKGEFKKEAIDALLDSHEFPGKILLKAADLGFLGIHIPEAFDGEGLGYQEKIVIAEELAKGHSTLGCCLSLSGYRADILLLYGSDAQKKNWLPNLAGGEILCASGLEDRKTLLTACKDKKGWVITGTIPLAVNGGNPAGFYIIPCQTSDTASPAIEEQAWSLFLVNANLPGIIVQESGKRLGQSMLPLVRIEFKNVLVPDDSLLGGESKGEALLRAAGAADSLTLAALAVGVAQGAFDRALDHARQRQQFGKKLIQFQITRHKLALMATRIEMARLMTRKAAAALDKGREQIRTCAMAKLSACRIAVEVCDEALQLFGGYGYIQEYEIEAYYRDAKMLQLFSGGPHALKDTIADNL